MSFAAMKIAFAEHCVERTFFRRNASILLIGVSSLVCMSEPMLSPERRFAKECQLSFGTDPTRPVRLHSGAFVALRKLHWGVQRSVGTYSDFLC